jgi:hypothetical protein
LIVQGKERLLKKRSPQHNKPTNPNSEVPPQDAQLQGVVSMASTIHNNQTQTVKLPPQDAQLQGVKPMVQYTTQKQIKVTKRSLQGQVRNFRWMKDKARKPPRASNAQLLSSLS